VNATIAVVLATFDGAKYLEGLCASLEAQRYPRERWRLIVVDNGPEPGVAGWFAERAPAARVLVPGDNLGYAIGCYGGRRLLNRYRQFFHISPAQISQGERLFEKHGPVTVFFARFIFGMRIITGPLAGVLRMHWKDFALFNFLGALAWVTVVACAGYLFGRQWQTLVRWVGDVDLLLAVIVALVIVAVVWRARRSQTPDE